MNPVNSRPSLPTRRTFLQSSALAAAAFSLPRFSIGQTGPSANSRINVACIGIGNRGFFAVSELMKDPRVNLVAFAHYVTGGIEGQVFALLIIVVAAAEAAIALAIVLSIFQNFSTIDATKADIMKG